MVLLAIKDHIVFKNKSYWPQNNIAWQLAIILEQLGSNKNEVKFRRLKKTKV